MKKKRQEGAFVIPSLDGIRAFAFLLVFLGHAGVSLIPAGFGVTVFFFLSGYLITTLLRLEAERTGSISFKLFYLRRALRILPPFYIVLCVAAALSLLGVSPGQIGRSAVLAQFLHYSNYRAAFVGFDGMPAGTGVYWSLAVEEHFYALFPALYVLMLKGGLSGKRQQRWLFAICAGVFLWRCLLVFHYHAPSVRTYLTTDTRFDSLLLGCALAVWGNPMLDRHEGEQPSLRWALIVASAAALLLVSFLVRDERFRETLRYSLQGIALYPLFYVAVRFPDWGPFRVFSLRVLGFLGKLSYSLYLVHQVVLAVLERWFAGGAVSRGVLAFAISLLLAWGMWLVVEKPAARARRRLESAVKTSLQAT